SRSARGRAAMTCAGGRDSAAPWPRRGPARSRRRCRAPGASAANFPLPPASWRAQQGGFARGAAGDVEKDLLEIGAAIAVDELLRRAAVDDAALSHHHDL